MRNANRTEHQKGIFFKKKEWHHREEPEKLWEKKILAIRIYRMGISGWIQKTSKFRRTADINSFWWLFENFKLRVSRLDQLIMLISSNNLSRSIFRLDILMSVIFRINSARISHVLDRFYIHITKCFFCKYGKSLWRYVRYEAIDDYAKDCWPGAAWTFI